MPGDGVHIPGIPVPHGINIQLWPLKWVVCILLECFLVFLYFSYLSDVYNTYNADFASKFRMWTLAWYLLHVFHQQNEKRIVNIKYNLLVSTAAHKLQPSSQIELHSTFLLIFK